MQSASLRPFLSAVMPKLKKEEIGSLSKPERQKLPRFYAQELAAHGLVRNLAEASKFSPAKVTEFLYSNSSYTKFTQATRECKIMRAFARFKNDVCI